MWWLVKFIRSASKGGGIFPAGAVHYVAFIGSLVNGCMHYSWSQLEITEESKPVWYSTLLPFSAMHKPMEQSVKKRLKHPASTRSRTILRRFRRQQTDFFMDWKSSKSYGCTMIQDFSSFSWAALTRCSRTRHACPETAVVEKYSGVASAPSCLLPGAVRPLRSLRHWLYYLSEYLPVRVFDIFCSLSYCKQEEETVKRETWCHCYGVIHYFPPRCHYATCRW